MKLAHFADLHIKARTNPYQQTLAEQVGGLLWAAQDAWDHKVDLILVAGDVFDGATGAGSPAVAAERNAAVEVFSALAEVAKVIVVRGNHDAPGEIDFLARLRTGGVPISVVSGYDIISVCGYAVHAIAWPQKRWLSDRSDGSGMTVGERAAAAMRAVLGGIAASPGPKIVLTHAEVTSGVFDSGQPATGRCDIPIDAGDLLDTGADYIALGHYHRHQVLDDRIVYAGAPRQLTFADGGPRGYVLADIGGWMLDIQHREIPGSKMLTFDLDDPDWVYREGDSIRITYETGEDERHARREFAEQRRQAAFDHGALAVKIDPTVRASDRVRSKEIASARTDEDRLRAYWRASEEPSRSSEILNKLGEIS